MYSQFSEAAMAVLNSDVHRVWKNEHRIENCTKVRMQNPRSFYMLFKHCWSQELLHEAKKFSKQTTQWMNLYQTFNDSLKEVGDVENWLSAIEVDMSVVSESMITLIETGVFVTGVFDVASSTPDNRGGL